MSNDEYREAINLLLTEINNHSCLRMAYATIKTLSERCTRNKQVGEVNE